MKLVRMTVGWINIFEDHELSSRVRKVMDENGMTYTTHWVLLFWCKDKEHMWGHLKDAAIVKALSNNWMQDLGFRPVTSFASDKKIIWWERIKNLRKRVFI